MNTLLHSADLASPRRTKIVGTLGPGTDAPERALALIKAGLDVARVNFSHGGAGEVIKRTKAIREAAEQFDRQIAILADLQGPKLRITGFKEGKIILEEGARFIIDTRHGVKDGDLERVGITYKDLPKDVEVGDSLLLDDGNIKLLIEEIDEHQVITRVIVGGKLSDSKGVNRQGGGLSASSLTDKDYLDIRTAAKIEADYLAVSFVHAAEDIHQARRLFKEAGGSGGIVAKIETSEALSNIDEIIEAADVVMIARGDLGVEVGDAQLVGLQKKIINHTRSRNRIVITATQMMQSMVDSPQPTRAEVMDVANAVLDGTDAVMLSAETAIGRHPEKVIEAMDRICRGAERERIAVVSGHRMDSSFDNTDEAIAMATMYTANHMGAKAIVALTESGKTAKYMSRISSGIPIYALTRSIATERRACLYRGVYPVFFDPTQISEGTINRGAVEELVQRGAVKEGDLLILTKGDFTGVAGGTNAMKIVTVGKVA